MDAYAVVKEEIVDAGGQLPAPAPASAPYDPMPPRTTAAPPVVIDVSSDDEDEDGGRGKRSRVSDGGVDEGGLMKRPKAEARATALPLGFPNPVPPQPIAVERLVSAAVASTSAPACTSRQFWKAGDYEVAPGGDPTHVSVGMDHVRVHPKFLHSNATSHKWALGALAELLDNSLDEVCNGATYVNVDMRLNKKDRSRMLLVEDNGGGMDPDNMRQCMSLGYSLKSKIANTIGQYGNGFKTSTMRLGADVIMFSRSRGKGGRSSTQSIGMLSYSFLMNTGKEDIVVPMLDYEKKGQLWNKMTRSSLLDWDVNLETIIKWSPYTSEDDLLEQFSSMTDQGTRIVIFNLWEDDQGALELDFDADEHDIQVRGVNRDEKKIQMAVHYPNSRHFLTYRHSLRSYASILYLRLPNFFRIILRGKDIEHHNLVTDMMLKQEVIYRPQPGADGVPKDPDMVATVIVGFVKDAKDHIDIQGFNVYHKNRLIKPFWRVWNAAGSDGRGVIGVLEANFVEPAHDKQGFERTTVLSRLEARLIQMQKTYWSTNCHKIGYAPRRNKKSIESEDRESSPDSYRPTSWRSNKDVSASNVSARYKDNCSTDSNPKMGKSNTLFVKHVSSSRNKAKNSLMLGNTGKPMHVDHNGILDSSDDSDLDTDYTPSGKTINGHGGSKISLSSGKTLNGSGGSKISLPQKSFQKDSGHASSLTSPCSRNYGNAENSALNGGLTDQIATRSQSKVGSSACNGNGFVRADSEALRQLKDENETLKKRIKQMEETMSQETHHEREKLLTLQLEEAQNKLEEANKEQEALIDIFSEERSRRDREEENLRKKLKDASATIQDLLEKLASSRNNR